MLERLPKKCPNCGNGCMYLQFLEEDGDTDVKILGSACIECQKVWVESREGLENHPHEEDILEYNYEE